MAGNHTLGTIRGTIEIDYDGAGVVRAIRDTDKLKTAGERAANMSNKVLSAFGKFARGAVAVSAGVGSAYNVLTLVAGTLAVIGPLAGAAFAAAPGIIAGFVAASLVLKIALSGVSEALGAAGEDSKKFEEAIKNLSPEAQKFARAYRAALPALNSFKNAVQDAFFQGLGPELTATVAKLGSLKGGAVGIAGAFNTIVTRVMQWARSNEAIAKFQTILAGVRTFLVNVDGAIVPLIDSFISLAAQASAFAEAAGGGLAASLLKLANFIKGIDLAALFERALPILQALGQFLGNVGIIASELFGMFAVDGANAAGILGELAGQLAAFLQSATGQEALRALGLALQAIATGAGQIFMALLLALTPVLVALAPGITILAQQISGLLVPAITAVGPVLAAMANFLSQNMSWIGPLVGVVVAAAAAYRIYAAAATAVAAVQAVLNSALLLSAAGWIRNTAVMIANRVAMVAGAAAMAIVRGAILAWTAVQWLLNAALSANPIGLVVIAIAALVAGLIYAWNNSETFRRVVTAAWNGIKAAALAVVNWFTGTALPFLKSVWNAIVSGIRAMVNSAKAQFQAWRNMISTVLNAIRSVISSVWNAIVSVVRARIAAVRSVIQAGMNAARAVVSAVMNAIRSVVSAVFNAIVGVVRGGIARVKATIAGVRAVVGVVRSAFNQATSAIRSAIGNAVSAVRTLPGRVSSALGGLGSLLYNKGRALIQGFVNGIGSMIGAVRNKVSSVVGAVSRFLPGSPAKEGPLSGRGYVLLRAKRMMADFAKGIQQSGQEPRRALLGAVRPIPRAIAPAVYTGPRAGGEGPGMAATAGGGTRVYQLKIGQKTFTSLVVDAVTGNPVAVADANKEGTRQSAWVGSGR